MNEKIPTEIIIYLAVGLIIGASVGVYLISYALTVEEVWSSVLIVLGAYAVFLLIAFIIIPRMLIYIQFFISDTLRWFLEH